VEQYWKKFSGPLLDRIDIRVPVFPPGNPQNAEQRFALENTSTEALRIGIARAVCIQRRRQGMYNSALPAEDVSRFCALTSDAENALCEASLMYGFSSRSAASCRKIARTIADMAGSEAIGMEHIQEAVFFRKNEGGMSFDFL
jgi:magnesium chelatase family protein